MTQNQFPSVVDNTTLMNAEMFNMFVLTDMILTSGGIPAASLTLTVAQPTTTFNYNDGIQAQTVSVPAQSITFQPSTTTYVDLSVGGQYTLSTAAAGSVPAVAPQSIRLYIAVTSAGQVTTITDIAPITVLPATALAPASETASSAALTPKSTLDDSNRRIWSTLSAMQQVIAALAGPQQITVATGDDPTNVVLGTNGNASVSTGLIVRGGLYVSGTGLSPVVQSSAPIYAGQYIQNMTVAVTGNQNVFKVSFTVPAQAVSQYLYWTTVLAIPQITPSSFVLISNAPGTYSPPYNGAPLSALAANANVTVTTGTGTLTFTSNGQIPLPPGIQVTVNYYVMVINDGASAAASTSAIGSGASTSALQNNNGHALVPGSLTVDGALNLSGRVYNPTTDGDMTNYGWIGVQHGYENYAIFTQTGNAQAYAVFQDVPVANSRGSAILFYQTPGLPFYRSFVEMPFLQRGKFDGFLTVAIPASSLLNIPMGALAINFEHDAVPTGVAAAQNMNGCAISTNGNAHIGGALNVTGGALYLGGTLPQVAAVTANLTTQQTARVTNGCASCFTVVLEHPHTWTEPTSNLQTGITIVITGTTCLSDSYIFVQPDAGQFWQLFEAQGTGTAGTMNLVLKPMNYPTNVTLQLPPVLVLNILIVNKSAATPPTTNVVVVPQTINAVGQVIVMDATTTVPGIVEIDQNPPGAHPIAPTLDSTGHLRSAILPVPTSSTPGAVKAGSNTAIAGDGTITVTGTVNGGAAATLTLYTANHLFVTTDTDAICDATAGSFTMTMPTAVGATRTYTIKRKDNTANTVTVNCTIGGQTIDTVATYSLAYDESITLESDGSNWWIV